MQGAGLFCLYTLVNDAGGERASSPCGPQLDAYASPARLQRCTGVVCPEKRLCFLRLPLPLRSRCFGVEGDRECN